MDNKAAEIFWNSTHGTISKTSLDALRNFAIAKYQCPYAKGKVLNFAQAFLKYLTKTHLDTRYQVFEIFLQKLKVLKERKNVTTRIITTEDIANLITHITKDEWEGNLRRYKAQQFTAFVLFGAYTGQRIIATILKLSVGQFRDTLWSHKPVLHVSSSQDKIKMEHYVPLHPQVVKAIQPLLDGGDDDKPVFQYYSLYKWVGETTKNLTCKGLKPFRSWRPSQIHSHLLLPTYQPPTEGCHNVTHCLPLFLIAELVPPRFEIRPFLLFGFVGILSAAIMWYTSSLWS